MQIESDDAVTFELGHAGAMEPDIGVYSVTYAPNGLAEDTWWLTLDEPQIAAICAGEMNPPALVELRSRLRQPLWLGGYVVSPAAKI